MFVVVGQISGFTFVFPAGRAGEVAIARMFDFFEGGSSVPPLFWESVDSVDTGCWV